MVRGFLRKIFYTSAMENARCPWCGTDPLYVSYHDTAWGVPVHDDMRLFEFLVLESFQAGLSWLTILRRREGFRKAFAGFDPKKVAAFTEADVERLLTDTGIIRHRGKIEAAIANAHAFLKLQQDYGSACAYFWAFVGGKPIVNLRETLKDVPPSTELAHTLAKNLKQKGFKFLGPTTVYAHMQATGMVNDHLVTCFRHKQLAGAA